MTTLAQAALEIATWPPARRTKNAPSARIPWHMIEELRRVLEAHGIDWREIQRASRTDERRAARDWLLPHEREGRDQ